MAHFVVEQYRRLAAVLNDLQPQRGVKTLMVSSAAPREGKTLTITNLALTLSESYQQRVLLIDADLRRPSVHEVLGIPNRSGLVDVVRAGTLSFPTVEVTPHLNVLTAGHTDGSMLAQLASDTSAKCRRTRRNRVRLGAHGYASGRSSAGRSARRANL